MVSRHFQHRRVILGNDPGVSSIRVDVFTSVTHTDGQVVIYVPVAHIYVKHVN